MKKYLVLLYVAALSLAACSKTEIDETALPDKKIEFNVAPYSAQTRAGEVSLLGDTDHFSCKAYLHAVGVTDVQDYFGANGETITANNSTNPSAWLPSHDYYWPKSKDSYINFVSWYDNNGAPTINASAKTMTWSARTVATTDNIMFADVAWHYNNNNGALYKKDAVTEGVPTLFHHALAKLAIKAKCDPVEKADSQNSSKKTTWEVTLEGMKITGSYNTGTLALTNSEPTLPSPVVGQTQAWTGSWTTSGSAADINMGNSSTLTATEAVVLEERSILPQTLGDGVKLTFTLHIVTKYDGTKYSEEKIPFEVALNTLGSTPITKWEMNTKYTYVINVNPETNVVKFDPAVVPWTEENGGSYSIPSGQI